MSRQDEGAWPTSMQHRYLTIAETAIAAWENEQYGDTDWRKPLVSNPDANHHQIAAARLLNERRLRRNRDGVVDQQDTDWLRELTVAMGELATQMGGEPA